MLREFQRKLQEKKSEIAEAITREAGKPVAEALTHRSAGGARCGAVPDRQRLSPAARRAASARKSCHEAQARAPAARALWRGGNHFALELSFFDSRDRDARGAGGGKCGGAEALGIYFSGRAGTAIAVARGGRAAGHFSGCGRRRRDRRGAALQFSKIDKLVFTGSMATGKRIAAAAAERLLPVVLELGGKDPMLVLDDADMDVVSSAAVWGAFVNAGQACLSVERCYVHRSLYEDFLRACAEKTKKLRVGPRSWIAKPTSGR